MTVSCELHGRDLLAEGRARVDADASVQGAPIETCYELRDPLGSSSAGAPKPPRRGRAGVWPCTTSATPALSKLPSAEEGFPDPRPVLGVVREPRLSLEAVHIDPGRDARMDEKDIPGSVAVRSCAAAGKPRRTGEPVRETGDCRGGLDALGDRGQSLAQAQDRVRISLVRDRGATVHEPQPEGLRMRQAHQVVHRSREHYFVITGKHGEAVAQELGGECGIDTGEASRATVDEIAREYDLPARRIARQCSECLEHRTQHAAPAVDITDRDDLAGHRDAAAVRGPVGVLPTRSRSQHIGQVGPCGQIRAST